jgi:hypothetical protein
MISLLHGREEKFHTGRQFSHQNCRVANPKRWAKVGLFKIGAGRPFPTLDDSREFDWKGAFIHYIELLFGCQGRLPKSDLGQGVVLRQKGSIEQK